MGESYISVTEINNYIRAIFEAEVMLQNICVYGEIGSLSVSNNIAYFNLKDENGLIQCVLFNASTLKNFSVGDMVLVRGSLSYYAKGGKLSFNAVSVMPYGKGLLYEKFLRLKEELGARGYFDESHKKPLPKYVKRIGVVSSPTGAVIRDIIDVTTRRNDTVDIVLYPVKVQGIGAEKEIASGIDFFSNYDKVDVVIVARGGGSMEDLEPFNSEIVATSTFNCKKPIVSAVGHETDYTIIDFVSDLRAPTPSASAELVVYQKSDLINDIFGFEYEMLRSLRQVLGGYQQRIVSSAYALENIVSTKLDKFDSRLQLNLVKMDSIGVLLDNKTHMIEKLALKIDSLNPQKIAGMGYSKVLKNGKVLSSKADVSIGDELKVSLIDGQISTKVIG